jgi:MFS family permease
MPKSEGFAPMIRAMAGRDFRIFTIGRFFGWVGVWIHRTALGWLVWEMTHSATWLGIFTFANLIPAIFVSPIAGAIADRVDRMRMLEIFQFCLLIHGILIYALIAFELQTIPLLLILAIVQGLSDACAQPATHALVPALLPQRDLTAAYGISALSFNLSRFIGPPIAGFAISEWGLASAMGLNALAAAAVCLALLAIKLKAIAAGANKERRLLRDVRDGFGYAARHEGIGPLLLALCMMALLVFHFHQFLPAFSGVVYDAGVNGLAWLYAAMGVGAMAQAVTLARRGGVSGLTSNAAWSFVATGLAVIGMTVTSDFRIGLFASFLVGFALSGSRVTSMTLLQNAVVGDMRGRVVSMYAMITHGGPAIGAIAVGVAADIFGLRPTFAVCGLLAICVGIWVLGRKARMEAMLESRPKSTEA